MSKRTKTITIIITAILFFCAAAIGFFLMLNFDGL